MFVDNQMLRRVARELANGVRSWVLDESFGFGGFVLFPLYLEEALSYSAHAKIGSRQVLEDEATELSMTRRCDNTEAVMLIIAYATRFRQARRKASEWLYGEREWMINGSYSEEMGFNLSLLPVNDIEDILFAAEGTISRRISYEEVLQYTGSDYCNNPDWVKELLTAADFIKKAVT